MRLIHSLGRWVGVAAIACAAALGATPALGATTDCPPPPLSQPFLGVGDANLYFLAPGGDFSSATAGWEMSGGASIVQATQANGTTGGVLDLPSKAVAISPVVCITPDYPTARLRVRNLVGSEGVFFAVSYNVNGVWTAPQTNGRFDGDKASDSWNLPKQQKVQPMKVANQQVRFIFTAGGNTSHFQVDDFWVDPRAL